MYRIPLPLPQDGLRAVNVYAIAAGDDLVLVDAGWALEQSLHRLASGLNEIGRSLGDITRFLVTHIHRDHYTQAVVVRRTFGTRISVGIGERPGLEAILRPGHTAAEPQIRQLRTSGAQPVIDALLAAGFGTDVDISHWGLPDDWLTGEATVTVDGRALVVVSTPGHTQGHVVFADLDHGLLFAGDHVLPHITPSIGFEPAPGSLPLGDYLQSLAAVRRMPDLRLLPAHGPVATSTHRRVDELLAHHAARLDACRDAVGSATGTAYETARTLPWTRRNRRFDDLDPFNQMLATTETAAHLDLLAAQGALTRTTSAEGVHHYEAG